MSIAERYSDLLLESILVFAVLLVVAMIILAATLLVCALLSSKYSEERAAWFKSLLSPCFPPLLA